MIDKHPLKCDGLSLSRYASIEFSLKTLFPILPTKLAHPLPKEVSELFRVTSNPLRRKEQRSMALRYWQFLCLALFCAYRWVARGSSATSNSRALTKSPCSMSRTIRHASSTPSSMRASSNITKRQTNIHVTSNSPMAALGSKLGCNRRFGSDVVTLA